MDNNKFKIMRTYYLIDGIKQSAERRELIINNNTICIYNKLIDELMEYLNEDLKEYKVKENDNNHSSYLLYKLIPVIN